MTELDEKQKRGIRIVVAYPFVLLVMSILVNLLLLDIAAFKAGVPTEKHLWAIAIAGIAFAVNHSWLMTATEITRARYRMHATPEEWKASGTRLQDVPEPALRELERNHNAHRNANENTGYFVALLIPFVLVSPPVATTYVWLIGFALSRLGYTYGYLRGNDTVRSVFMTLGLLAMYGVASYLVLSAWGWGVP